ncbi:MAG: gliding motility-associated ABC transporter substrate-binding protein GldG [Bacteroidetes bacterium GWE2_29_8]|nr:MAG: gliding motility-associated ABC transporter substrate-binding protein GldG [Bacteroidetes bacterium GWE2_29_8]OFY20358.1 MAG: gliding motility-associated ABC transporter substrate-binding protein GldG [Bacteroidetes bacterium GWF2_29_10]
MKKKELKKYNITQLILSLFIVIFINVIISYFPLRLDLTKEKRYTLSDATKNMLRNIDDVVLFKIYLEGDFPAGFKRLRNETKEMLNQFRAYSKYVEYEFVNPTENADKKKLRSIYKQLMDRGLEPTNLQVKDKTGKTSQQIIFPCALVSYKGQEMPLQLLKSQIGVNSENVLNNSIQGLEYSFASVLKKLSSENKPLIGFIGGHGELSKIEIADFAYTLAEFYKVKKIDIRNQIKSLEGCAAIIIAQPDSIFDEKDKFIIDQFIMKGGKTLWLIDPVFASMDSLRNSDVTPALPIQMNINDMLFKYGVKLNYNLILDLKAVPIPIVTGYIGKQPQQSLLPWFYFPLIMPTIDHPIVKNVNAIKAEFVSSIDTVAVKNVKKTILLATSKYSRIVACPSIISLELMKAEPDYQLYNKPPQTVAVLLEGKFQSLYRNRLTPEIEQSSDINFKNESVNTKMIIVSDGDMARNQIYNKDNQTFPYPLGYDKWTQQTYGNKDFLLNSVNYLCDDDGMINIRSRELTLRLLDKTKINEHGLYLKILNIIAPILLIVLFGLYRAFRRKKLYTT